MYGVISFAIADTYIYPSTKAQWGLCFVDILADALELGPLRNTELELPYKVKEKLNTELPKGVPLEIVCTLIAYYHANRPEKTDWVVLPVANFDAYFGSTSFSRKILKQIPQSIIERSDTGFGLCRYRVNVDFVK